MEPPLAEPYGEDGDVESFRLCAWLDEVGVVDGVSPMEFLRDAFFAERVEAAPTGI